MKFTQVEAVSSKEILFNDHYAAKRDKNKASEQKMTQLERLKVWIPDEQNEDLLSELLLRAEDSIKRKRRTPVNSSMEKQYETLQLEIAQFLYNKMGAEGETAHNENGVSRTYENAHIPDSMLDCIVPLGKVIN